MLILIVDFRFVWVADGVMWDVRCKEHIPAAYIQVQGIAVRGMLGPMTIWMTRGGFIQKHTTEAQWDLVHQEDASPSFRKLRTFKLEEPIRLRPGEVVGLYVHSSSTTTEDCIV